MRDRLCGQEYFLKERARRKSLRSTHISGKTSGSTGALAVPVEGIWRRQPKTLSGGGL